MFIAQWHPNLLCLQSVVSVPMTYVFEESSCFFFLWQSAHAIPVPVTREFVAGSHVFIAPLNPNLLHPSFAVSVLMTSRDMGVCNGFSRVYCTVERKFAMPAIWGVSSHVTWFVGSAPVFITTFWIKFCCCILQVRFLHIFHHLCLPCGWAFLRDLKVYAKVTLT